MADAIELARRLRQAMDSAEPRVTSAQLARECGVTPQAVNGWRKNGRLAKRHLSVLSRLTKRPLSFFIGGDDAVVAEPPPIATHEDPRVNRLIALFYWLTEAEKQAVLQDVEARAAGNRLIAKEIGPKLDPVCDNRVARAIKTKAGRAK